MNLESTKIKRKFFIVIIVHNKGVKNIQNHTVLLREVVNNRRKLLGNSNKQIYTQNNTFITAIDPFHRTICLLYTSPSPRDRG